MIITNELLNCVSGWEEQVAGLIYDSWASNGDTFFPYAPMTKALYWYNEAPQHWQNGIEYSRFYLDERGMITACACMVRKEGYWELGRFNSRPTNPKGVMLNLAKQLMSDPRVVGQRILCEATQAHTSSQYIAKQVGLRFAGYGFFRWVDGIPWDILYFDNSGLKEFTGGRVGCVNNVFGRERGATNEEIVRLREVTAIISIERSSGFPPTKFHILDDLELSIRSIIANNT